MPPVPTIDSIVHLIQSSLLFEDAEKDQLLAKLPKLSNAERMTWRHHLQAMALREREVIAKLPPEKLKALKQTVSHIRYDALSKANELTKRKDQATADALLEAALGT